MDFCKDLSYSFEPYRKMIFDPPSRSNIDHAPKQAVYQTLYNAESCILDEFTLQENRQLVSEDGNVLISWPVEPGKICWLHSIGINDSELLKQILAPYRIHDLVIEDILNNKQRPKIEEYPEYLFIAARVFQYNGPKLQSDPVFIIIGQNFVLTFQSRPLGLFTEIRSRFADNRQHIRNKSIAYLAYLFIDRLVDDYFITLEQYNTRAETIDKTLFKNDEDTNTLLLRIHSLKRDAVRLRRTLIPLREVINALMRGDYSMFDNDLRLYIRDAYDHMLQLVESLEASRDMVWGMMDVHLSFQSNRLNQQMRLLTVITVIFMPLTLLTGIYGMNFDNMPELHWHYGYFILLGVMATIIISLLVFFNRRKWL